MAEFNMEMQYKPEKENCMVNALSARLNLQPRGNFMGCSTIDFIQEPMRTVWLKIWCSLLRRAKREGFD